MFRLCVALVVLGAVSMCAPALAAGPPPVEAYGKREAVEQISLSPSGERFAFVAVVGQARTLVAMTADGKTPLVAVPVGQAKVVAVDWVGEDHILVEIYHTVPLGMDFEVSKAEFSTVVAINLKTRTSIGVFEHHADVSDIVEHIYGAAQVGGRWYGYFGGITYGADRDPSRHFLDHMWPDLYRVDLDTGAIDIAARGSELAWDWLVGPDGQIIA